MSILNSIWPQICQIIIKNVPFCQNLHYQLCRNFNFFIRKDWGALILIDERFGKSAKYVKGLSKWVRQRVGHYSVFTDAMSSLNEFVSMHLQKDEEEALSQM